MINTDGETFLNASEASRYLRISRVTFYKDYIGALTVFRIGKRRRRHYCQSELAALMRATPVEKVA